MKNGKSFCPFSGPCQVLRYTEQEPSGVVRISLLVRERESGKEKMARYPQSRALSSCHASEITFLSLLAIKVCQVT